MGRRSNKPAPTEEQIRALNNVPYEMAASFIGCGDYTVRVALQQGRAPFGFAALNEEKGTWSYNISPGLLIKYKNGELVCNSINDVMRLVEHFVNKMSSTPSPCPCARGAAE